LKTLVELEALLDFYNINLSIVPLDPLVRGYYLHDNSGSFILINTNVEDTRTYRCVLAEEIGHHLTTVGDILPHGYPNSSAASSNVNRQELKAMRWATEYLMPTDEIISFISSELGLSMDALASHFEVMESFVLEKFQFMAKEKLSWPLDQERALMLANLPSAYIVNVLG
jgi:Zn-dependent peptidase ImmA (M78 family)